MDHGSDAGGDRGAGRSGERGDGVATAGGNFRIVEFAPERDYPAEAGDALRGFAELGHAPDALVAPGTSRHPGMHRTRSVDYGIVLEGEIWLLLDDGETSMRRGDVCIQRGTSHAWSNRSVGTCTMTFVLIDGE